MYRLEGEYMQVTENCINKCIAGRSDIEYRRDKKDIINQRDKEYYEKNKEIIQQKSKEYNEKNKEKIREKITCEDCGSVYTLNGRAKHFKTQKHLQAVEENAKKIEHAL